MIREAIPTILTEHISDFSGIHGINAMNPIA